MILPVPSPLQRSHYDLAFYQLSIRNVANYSPPVLEPDGPRRVGDAAAARRRSPPASRRRDDVEPLDRLVAGELLRREVGSEHSPVHGRDVDELLAELEPRRGPERLLDILLRCGPYGDGFGARPDGLTLAALEAAPHGIDLGPLEPRLPDAAAHAERPDRARAGADRRRRRAPARGARARARRRRDRARRPPPAALEQLLDAQPRAARQRPGALHAARAPRDAERLGLADGEPARVSNRAGAIEAPVEVTDAVMPGVVSLPHGWGHDAPGARLAVAGEHAGVNSNVLADEQLVDALSGNAVLNGIPVVVAPVPAPIAA